MIRMSSLQESDYNKGCKDTTPKKEGSHVKENL